MLKLSKIAVTGGVSCGKSTVCRFFKELGAYVVSADEIVHQLLTPKTDIGQKVIQLVGSDVVVDGKIDRTKIAKKVFNNPGLLKFLEELLHPAVRAEVEKQYQQVGLTHSASLFVAEIPLLFESGWEHDFDYTVVVIADSDLCKQRFVKATGYTEEEFYKRSARLMNMKEKAEKADFVIVNNGEKEELQKEIKAIFNSLCIK